MDTRRYRVNDVKAGISHRIITNSKVMTSRLALSLSGVILINATDCERSYCLTHYSPFLLCYIP